MMKKLENRKYFYIFTFTFILTFFFYSSGAKVSAAVCPSVGPVTTEWKSGNSYIRSVDLPANVGPINLSGYLYEFWVVGKKPDYDCDRLLFELSDYRYVKEITFKAHDKVDTAGFEIYVLETNGSWRRVWQNLDLDSQDGCGQGGNCYTSFTVTVGSTIKTIQFLGKHDTTERVYLDFGSVKGFDCPSNLRHSCSADGSQATFNWDSVKGAAGYSFRLDKNAPSWYEPGVDIADIATSTSRSFSITPGVKNTYSVQAIGNSENYPYGGDMCWQEVTCDNTLPPNNLPKCSSNPLILNPNQTNFLPDSQVTVTANGYSDADNDPLTITNWQVTKGTILSTSPDRKSIVLKMPNTTNETVSISYTVSDGKSNVTCNSPAIVNLTTNIKYACSDSQCKISASGFDTQADCLSSCPGAQKKYSCTSNGQCIYDTVNPIYDSPNCDNKCAPATVSCENINVSGSLTDGAQVSLSANVKNFPEGGTPSTYQWVSQYGTLDISGDPNCNQSTKICNMQNNKAYTTSPIKYTVPISDTVYFKVNGNVVSSCTLNVNNTMGKDITMQFDKAVYDSVSVGPNDNTVLLQTTPLTNFSSYFLKLTCVDKDTNIPCPANSFRFKDTPELDKTTKLLSSIVAGTTYNDYVYLNFTNPVNIVLKAEGNTLPETPGLYRSDTADVIIKKPSSFSMSVVYAGDGVYKSNKSDYCNSSYPTAFKQVFADFENTATNTHTNYDLESSTPPSTLASGLYNLSLSLKPSVTKKEIKCIKVNSTTTESSSVSLNSDGSNMNVYVVVGATEGNTWYEAFGGSAYSKGSIISPIEDIATSVLNTVGNIWSGVLQSSGLEVNNGIAPERYVVHPSGSTYLSNKDIADLQTELDTSSVAKISDLSSVSKDSDITNFYYLSNGSNTLNIASDFKINLGKKTPVVFVKGVINISNTVKQVDLILISTDTINVGTDSSLESDMIINGGLLAKNNVNFKSLNVVPDVNGKLSEKIYFMPSVYFTNTLDAMYFKNINIYTNLID